MGSPAILKLSVLVTFQLKGRYLAQGRSAGTKVLWSPSEFQDGATATWWLLLFLEAQSRTMLVSVVLRGVSSGDPPSPTHAERHHLLPITEFSVCEGARYGW